MSVKPSYFRAAMKRLLYVVAGLLYASALTSCSTIGGWWNNMTNERDSQIVGGPKHTPPYNTGKYQQGMAPEVLQEIYGSPYSLEPTSSSNLNSSSQLIQYEAFVPVEPAATMAPPPAESASPSDPVILKYNSGQDPYNKYNQGGNPPAPEEPSLWDRVSGWFSSSRDEKVVWTLVNNRETQRIPVSDNPVQAIPSSNAAEADLEVDKEYPPLSSVPPTPVRLKKARIESAAQKQALELMHRTSEEMRETVEQQREAEAPGSLLPWAASSPEQEAEPAAGGAPVTTEEPPVAPASAELPPTTQNAASPDLHGQTSRNAYQRATETKLVPMPPLSDVRHNAYMPLTTY